MPRSDSPSPRGGRLVKAERSDSAPSTPRQSGRQIGRQAWTDEEEDIWREMVVNVLRAHLLATVRADGRLNHRSGSLAAHLKAYIKKI